jgi:outer membrane protein TolC
MSLMPGLMMDFPGPGKLKWAANVASAESQAKYFAFESSVLQTAFALKRSYYQLYFLNGKVSVNQQTLNLLADLEKLARTQNEVGKVTLQDVLRAQIEQERLTTEIVNLEDSRNPLLAEFKAALGLTPEQPTPPVPQQFESTPLDLTSEQLFAIALTRNPRLKAMEAEVRRSDASIWLAYKARVPDFSVGVEADAKATPVFVTPRIGVTLPIWRDKIAAQIAEAQAGKRASEARLTAEQIALEVEFAEKTFMFRESSRNLALLQERLLPKARLSLEVGRAAYLSSQIDFLSLISAQRTLLEFQLAEVEARTQRELALAEVSLLILGQPPASAPVLNPARTDLKPNTPNSKVK